MPDVTRLNNTIQINTNKTVYIVVGNTFTDILLEGGCGWGRFIPIPWCHGNKTRNKYNRNKKLYRTRETSEETVTFRFMDQSVEARNKNQTL